MAEKRQRASKYSALIESTFKPNADGVSDWVEVTTLIELGFPWTKNGNTRYGALWNDKTYEWAFKRKTDSEKSEILAVRTNGFRSSPLVNSAIRADIITTLKNSGVCNFSLLPVPIEAREVDHRFGYKDHPKYARINDPAKQKLEDFQLLHRSQNVQKRQMCIECIDSGIRPSHPHKPFVEGTAQLDHSIVCDGCYLAQPERYR